MGIDFSSKAAYGFAFVNLLSPAAAQQFKAAFNGFSHWTVPSRKVCKASWSDPHQGLVANIQRYRNSPVMHPNVPDWYKPLVFAGGVRTAFPPPSKTIRKPRLRNYSPSF